MERFAIAANSLRSKAHHPALRPGQPPALGGPLARAAAVLNVEVNTLFAAILPILGVSFVYVFCMAYLMGRKERERLGYIPSERAIVTPQQIKDMVTVIQENDREFKRPRIFLFTWR